MKHNVRVYVHYWTKELRFPMLMALSWIFANGLLVLAAAALPARAFDGRLPMSMTPLQLATLIAPALTLIMIGACHWIDKQRTSHGIIGRLRKIPAPRYRSDSALISSVVTKQSILAAIAITSLALFMTQVPAGGHQRAVWMVSILGFLLSITCTLVSILCYEVILRFLWDEDNTKDLLRKGLRVETVGWYSLTFSFTLCIAYFQPWLSLLVNLGYGTLLLYYYFPSRFLCEKRLIRKLADEALRSGAHPYELESIHLTRARSSDANPSAGRAVLLRNGWEIRLGLRGGSASQNEKVYVRVTSALLTSEGMLAELNRVLPPLATTREMRST